MAARTGENPASTNCELDAARVSALVEVVSDFLRRLAVPRRHHVACALQLASGRVVLGLNIVANLGPASVCAEQVVLGEALKRPFDRIELVATVRAAFDESQTMELVPPCGRCRELLREYAEEAQIILSDPGDTDDFSVAAIAALLPHPFVRRPRSAYGPPDTRQPPGALESGP